MSTPASEIATFVRAYLQHHPRAADTAEGIRRWWLPPSLAAVEPAAVTAALDQLMSEGVVSVRITTDGTKLYSKAR